MNSTRHLNIVPLRQALKSLNDALSPPPANDRERDGAIQRFEYTLELAWKIGGRGLELSGIKIASPKLIVREMAKFGWIDDPQFWLDCIDARNDASHGYSEEVAKHVFLFASKFPPHCKQLLDSLDDLSKKLIES